MLAAVKKNLPQSKLTLKYFLIAYGISIFIITSLMWYMSATKVQHELESLKTRQAANLYTAAQQLNNQINQTISDLRLVASLPSLSNYIEHGDEASRQQAALGFLKISESKRIYDQIRYLDMNGQERIRVNHKQSLSNIVPDSELQDKHERYYFVESFALPLGEMFFSPLDLNIEHGVLEHPLNPILRMAMPVGDSKGNKQGVVILNYYAKDMLDQFREHFSHSQGMLLNKQGYWLVAPNPEDEWGFMLEHQSHFGLRYPDIWHHIQTQKQGDLLTNEGMFVYSTIFSAHTEQQMSRISFSMPVSEALPSKHLFFSWKLISFIPTAQLPNIFNIYTSAQWLITLLILLLLGVLEWLLVSIMSQRHLSVLELKERKKQLQEMSDTLAEGIYTTDAKGNIQFVNKEACRLLGYSIEELQGKNAHQLFHYHQTQAEQEQCEMENQLKANDVYLNNDAYFIRHDQSLLPVAVSAKSIIRDQQSCGTVVAFHDITQRKQAEQYQRSNEERQHRIAELNRLMLSLSEAEVIQIGLGIAIDITHSKHGYLFFLREDQEIIYQFTWSAQHSDQNNITNKINAYTISKNSIWRNALCQQQAVIECQLRDEKIKVFYEIDDVSQHLVVPVQHNDQVRMMIGVLNKEQDYNEHDIQQLKEIANEIDKLICLRHANWV